MKLHPVLKKIVARSFVCASLTIMTGSLVATAQADSFTVDGAETDWLPVNNTVYVNDNAAGSTLIKVDGKTDATTNLKAGYATSGDVAGNTVELTNSHLKNIVGAYSEMGGSANNNVVTMSGSTGGNVSGGSVLTGTGRGEASGNTVTLKAGSVTANDVVGGEVYMPGTANNNTVNIEGSTVGYRLYGGYVKNQASNTEVSEASGNTIYVTSGSTVKYDIIGACVTKNGKTNNNKVIIIDSEATSRNGVYGVFLAGTKEGVETNEATGNSVIIENSKVVSASAACADYAIATNNSVTISNSTVTSYVYGSDVYGTGAHATNNEVVIEDSNVSGEIIGGYSEKGNATHNTVTLRGQNNELTSADIYGGYGAGDSVTGNTLVLDGFQGKVASVNNFDEIEVTLSDWNPAAYVMETAEEMDLRNKKVRLRQISSIAGDAELPDEGSVFMLFNNYSADATTTWEGFNSEYTNIKYGETKLVDITLDIDSTDGVIEEDSITYVSAESSDASASEGANSGGVTITTRLNPQLKALSEGRIAAMTFVNRAGDLAAEQGVAQAALAAAQEGTKVATFFAMSAGHEKVDSGSYVDADGVATMLGASVSTLKTKALTLGAFVEGGWGQYVTHNSFADPAVSNVRGSGESSYAGGGVLLRYACSSRRAQGLALDASLRAGKQDTDFGSYDVKGKYVAYDISNSYLAGHVGASYTFRPVHKVETTVYGRYLWSSIGSDHADTAPDRVDFESAHSNRLRVGARAAWQRFVKWTPYVGLAYEWECSGAARATANGERVDAPSMRGGSVMGEIGTSWKPMEQKAFWVNAALQGSAGKTQGYGASIGCTVAF